MYCDCVKYTRISSIIKLPHTSSNIYIYIYIKFIELKHLHFCAYHVCVTLTEEVIYYRSARAFAVYGYDYFT